MFHSCGGVAKFNTTLDMGPLFQTKYPAAMKSKFLIIAISVVFLLFCILFFRSYREAFFVLNHGTVVTGEVTRVPRYCNKHASIDITFEGKQYSHSVSRSSCREGVYRTGQAISIRWHPDAGQVLFRDEDPRKDLYILAGVFVVVVGLNIYNYMGDPEEKDTSGSVDPLKAAARDRTRRKSKRGQGGRFPLP